MGVDEPRQHQTAPQVHRLSPQGQVLCPAHRRDAAVLHRQPAVLIEPVLAVHGQDRAVC